MQVVLSLTLSISRCDSGFKGQACEEIETISFKQPSIETNLIHSYFILSIDSYYSNDLSLFIQNSIHEGFFPFSFYSL